MLYLLKASRVREYHKENLAILCADEHERFSVTYSRRWVQPDLSIKPGSGAAVVFADSPYEHYVPIRFAVVDSVEDTAERVTVHFTTGPFIRVTESDVLDRLWLPRSDDRPGKTWFLGTDENPGLLSPSRFEDADTSWRRAVDGLRSNGYFARSTLSRIVGVRDTEHGDEIDRTEPLPPGTEILVDLELRTTGASPTEDAPTSPTTVQVVTEAESTGAVEQVGVDDTDPADRIVTIRLRLVEAGAHRIRFTLRPDPLLSCRPTLLLTVGQHTPVEIGSPSDDAADPGAIDGRGLDVPALLRFLEREGGLDDRAWMQLCEDLLFPVADGLPVLLETYAAHAAAAGDHEQAYATLLRIDDRTGRQVEMLLHASLRTGHADVVRDQVIELDVSDDAVFGRLVRVAAESDSPGVHALVSACVEGDLLGEARLTELVTAVGTRITSVDLLCKVADNVAYTDPDAATRLFLDRWPRPDQMPEQALDLLVGWDVERDRMGPYLEHRIDHAAYAGDVDELRRLAGQVRRQGHTRQRAELLGRIGEHLLAAGSTDPKVADEGFSLCADAATTLAGFGEVDRPLALLAALRACERLWRSNEREELLALIQEAIGEAVETDDAFAEWRRFQAATACDALRPALSGRTIHLVGAKKQAWAGELETGLGLAALVWHESEKHKDVTLDWVGQVDERAVVVCLTDFIGHSRSVPLKNQCRNRKITYLESRTSRLALLAELRRSFDDR